LASAFYLFLTGVNEANEGFTIAKAFEYLREKEGAHAPRLGPRTVGIIMIATGLVALVLATNTTSAGFKGVARALPGPASIAGRSNGSLLRVAGHPRLVQRHF
jgi:hypothetical protein